MIVVAEEDLVTSRNGQASRCRHCCARNNLYLTEILQLVYPNTWLSLYRELHSRLFEDNNDRCTDIYMIHCVLANSAFIISLSPFSNRRDLLNDNRLIESLVIECLRSVAESVQHPDSNQMWSITGSIEGSNVVRGTSRPTKPVPWYLPSCGGGTGKNADIEGDKWSRHKVGLLKSCGRKNLSLPDDLCRL